MGTYAEVSKVEPNAGSIVGGTQLTITGKFFDDKSGIKAKVLVGGENCEVQSVEDEKIVCISPSKPTSNHTLHMGGRGVFIEELTSESAMYNETDSADYHKYHSDQVKLCQRSNTSKIHKTRASGFFRPTTTSNYTFYFDSSKDCSTCKLHMDTG